MNNIDWETVQEETDRPVPGGYIAGITQVEDNEQKEYLKIEWEFAEGLFQGNNTETYERAKFWPMAFIKSYKKKALGFFKRFKTAVEESNRGYRFNNDPQSLTGKYMGVVLAEEEYMAKDGSVKTRLYVSGVKSVQDIRASKFEVPPLKKLAAEAPAAAFHSGAAFPADFAQIYDEDAKLPF